MPGSRADVNTGSQDSQEDEQKKSNKETSKPETASQENDQKNKESWRHEDSQEEFERKNKDTIRRLRLEIDMEVSTQQEGRHFDDHQSTVTPKQYSASSPTHAHARTVAYHLTSSRMHSTSRHLTPHTRHSQFAHKDSLRRIQGKDPTSEDLRQDLAGRALTVHQRGGCSLHTCGLQEWCHSVATRHTRLAL